LDPDDPRPPYEQVAAALRAAIGDGRYQPGDQLPSRTNLAKDYAVAPMTVQAALRELREEGLIVSRQGAGVYVRRVPREDPATRLRTAHRVLSEIHRPISADTALCAECRDSAGLPASWPCRTWQQLDPILDDTAS
jgi:DNA-binding GntR family transcriptional regulator